MVSGAIYRATRRYRATHRTTPRAERISAVIIVLVLLQFSGWLTSCCGARLGTRVRAMLDQMDADVVRTLADLGITDYRSRFSAVVRAIAETGPVTIRTLAAALGITHSAASQSVAEMRRRGLVELVPGADARERLVQLTDTHVGDEARPGRRVGGHRDRLHGAQRRAERAAEPGGERDWRRRSSGARSAIASPTPPPSCRAWIPRTVRRSWAPRVPERRLLADIRPLRENPAYRRLWFGTTLSHRSDRR